MRSKIILFVSFVVLFCGMIGVSNAEAQTSKKKRTKPVATPTPVPVQSLPVVISRADQIPSQDPIIPNENPQVQPNADERIDKVNTSLGDLEARIKSLESSRKNEYDEKQKRLLLNLDILTRAEQRAETLRRQLFEMIEKQNTIQIRIEQITYDMQPAMIDRYAGNFGSLRPEEIREARRKALESERRNLESLMSQITLSRTSLEENVFKADSLVQKLRTKLEKDIDDALTEKEENQ
jgi:TolA-binding protein